MEIGAIKPQNDAKKNLAAGAFFVVLSSLLYGLEPNLHALVLKTGLQSTDTMPVRGLSALLISLIVCTARKESVRIPVKSALRLILIGAFGLGATGILLTTSYQFVPVGTATVVHYLYPTLICLATTIIFRRRATALMIAAMVLSVAGLAFFGGATSASGSYQGLVLAALSAVAFSFYTIMIGRNGSTDLPLSIRMFYPWIGSLLLYLVIRLIRGGSGTWTLGTVALIVLCGAINASGGYCFVAGVQRIGAPLAAFLSLLEPIASILFNMLFDHTVPTGASLIGCALSLLAILLITISTRNEHRNE